MIQLVMQEVAKDPAALFYSRKPTLFGNEAELRWKRYHNSRCWSVKVEYNVADDEDEAIRVFILNNLPGARVIP